MHRTAFCLKAIIARCVLLRSMNLLNAQIPERPDLPSWKPSIRISAGSRIFGEQERQNLPEDSRW
jgi:hypothetical protein